MGRRFGFECELAGGVSGALAELHQNGLIAENRLHGYHCSCETCDPFDERFSFHAQNDCTCDGEIILNVHEHGSDRANKAISGLAKALRKARAETSTDSGFHVHVDRRDLNPAQIRRVARIFLRYQDSLGELAATRFSNVRGYNTPWSTRQRAGFWTHTDEAILGGPFANAQDFDSLNRLCPGGRGSWLWPTHYGTFEFRLWNSTLAEWRMRLAVGMSVAIVDAAADGVNAEQWDTRPLEEVVGPYMDEDTWAGVLRQRFSKGGMVNA